MDAEEQQAWEAYESQPVPDWDPEEEDWPSVRGAKLTLAEYAAQWTAEPGLRASAAWSLVEAIRVWEELRRFVDPFLERDARETVEDLVLNHVAHCRRTLDLLMSTALRPTFGSER
jgi:hypothetical protein